MGTDKNISFTGGVSEVGSVPALQATNTSGSSLASMGFRGTDLRFATGSAERMRIDSSGNVGIGTTSPATKTHISKSYTAPTGGHDGNLALVVSNSSTADSYAGIGIGAGNNAGSFIHFGDTDDDNVGALNYFHFDDTFQFVTASQARMTIDSSGNVGIGTSAPERRFQVRNGNNGEIKIGGSGSSATGFELRYNNSGTTDAQIQNRYRTSNANALINIDTGILTVSTGNSGTERMRIDSSGRLLVGTTSAINSGYTNGSLHLRDNAGGVIAFKRNDGSDTNSVGILEFHSSFGRSASIVVNNDGNHSGSSTPGAIIFSTTPNGTFNTPSERLRITHSGTLQMGDPSNPANGRWVAFMSDPGTAAQRGRIVLYAKTTSTAGQEMFQVFTGTTEKLRIRADGNILNANDSYGSLSDEKLKENIVDAGSQWADFKAVRFRKFNFKEETGHETFTQLGVIAQELELTSPGLVYEDADKDQDGNDLGTTTKSVKSSILTKKGLVALQEAMARIEQLEAKVAALEAG
jgi:hypothetical protein